MKVKDINTDHKIGDKFTMILEIDSTLYSTREKTIKKVIETINAIAPNAVESEIGFLWDKALTLKEKETSA